MNPISIYIHWPFCLSLCPYCDFNSHISEIVDDQLWLDAYKTELTYFSKHITGRKVRSIFFGGGTPSLMNPMIVENLIKVIADTAIIDIDTEITLEANPTSYETKKFEQFKSAGVNRVSIGVQSLDNKSLSLLGRKHNVDDAIKSIESAAKLFNRYSYDLIYALQDQTLASWQKELGRALTLAKNHISLYQLTIEKGTPFFKLHNDGKLILPSNDVAADMYEWTNEYLNQFGFNRYEISNYAIEGQESIHNLCYWNYDEYIGIGPGAHSRLHLGQTKEAVMMIHKPHKWLEQVRINGNGIGQRIILNRNEVIKEVFMMGTRLESGFSLDQFQQKTGLPLKEVLDMSIVTQYQDKKLVLLDENLFKLTANGLLLHSYLIPRMLKNFY